MFKVYLAPKAEKSLAQTAEYKKQISERLKELETTPFIRGSIKLIGHEHCYRVRVGKYRVQFYVNFSQKEIIVYKISRRSETTYSE